MAERKRKPAGKKSQPVKKKIPWGRTLSTFDHFLGRSKTGSTKKRPVVVIETNKRDELAVVPLSSRSGEHRTRLKGYQQGKSYFKHFVEIEDNEGKPIKVDGVKFRANNRDLDVSRRDVMLIRDRVFTHSIPAPENRKKMRKFRK